MRTPEEIAEQIKHLKSIKPPAALNSVVARRIRLCIHALSSDTPLDTSGFDDIGDQMCVWATERWKSGIIAPLPAEGWPKEKA